VLSTFVTLLDVGFVKISSYVVFILVGCLDSRQLYAVRHTPDLTERYDALKNSLNTLAPSDIFSTVQIPDRNKKKEI
jgi:hypothetical protein